ncbi:MAG: elongation factor G, partial [Spirochaetota bacterium]
FVDMIKGGAIPNEFIPSVRKGLEKTLEEGILAGYEILDVRAILEDGNFHPVDSSDMAFQLCASMCMKKAFPNLKPVILEPIMSVEVNTPDDYLGDVIGDLNKRRGKIGEMRRFRKGSQKVDARVPLVEMFGYATTLRSLSSGRANYSMEFDAYEPVPANIQEKVIKEAEEKKRQG